MNSNCDNDGPKKEENNQMGKMPNERTKENGGKKGEKEKEEAEKQKGGENGKKQLKESGEEFPLLVDEEEKAEEEERTKCPHNKSGRCPWCDKKKDEDIFDD
ncbi:hypothetical protein niasHT_015598 [Heterodera trifolii]|uniref:Uncharacterized protein n=1 Tax=Heterodera trifolii TaxID=157864 RepID=A0ABD2LCE3_9BILA